MDYYNLMSMKNINLLSEKYTGRMKIKIYIHKMVAIVAIFFLIWTLILITANLTISKLKQRINENNSIILDEKYIASERIVNELRTKRLQANGKEELNTFGINMNMSLQYLTTVIEEFGSVEAREILVNNIEYKITLRAEVDAKSQMIDFINRLYSLQLFKNIDLIEMSLEGEKTLFTVELKAGEAQ